MVQFDKELQIQKVIGYVTKLEKKSCDGFYKWKVLIPGVS